MTGLGSLRTLALGLTLGGGLGVGLYFKGRADGRSMAEAAHAVARAQWSAAAVARQAAVDAQNVRLQDQVTHLTQEHMGAQARLDRLVRTVGQRLSERPARSAAAPDTGARPAAGADDRAPRLATGAELYREDGEFLVREAARADQIRLALTACLAQYRDLEAALTAVARATPSSKPPTVAPR